MNNLSIIKKVGLVFLVLALVWGGAYLARPIPPKPNPELVAVDKKELYQLTYEWAMYKEIATLLYAAKWNVSKKQAQKHLEEGVNDAVEKQFISWYENRAKWEKK